MKKRISKSLMFFLVLSALMTVFFVSASAKTVTSGDFKFDVVKNTATLIEYKGNAKTVKIPSKVSGATVTKIGDEAFWSKNNMTSVTIPSTVTSIGKAAFNECTALTKVTIPSKVKSIGSAAFWYCTSLKQIIIPKSVEKIGTNAFRGCNSLTAYVIKGSFAEKYVKDLDNVKLAYRYATSIKLNKTTATAYVGQSGTIKATLSPSPLYSSKVEFTSSNKNVATVTSSGKVTGVSCGTAVITAAAKDGSGKKATCTVKVVPEKVTGVKQTYAGKTSVKLSWNSSDGAERYYVYKYDTAAKKYVSIGNVAKTNCNISGLNLGAVEKYKIRAYKKVDGKAYWSAYSTVITAKTSVPAKVTGLKTTSTDTTINLSWSKVSGADGYRIYLYDAAKNTYTYKFNVTALSRKIVNVKPNTEYSFAVKAYFSSGKSILESSAYSAVITQRTCPSSVKGLAVAENSVYYNKLTLQWNKDTKVDAYQIALLGADGEYDIIKTIEGNDVTSYEVTGLESSTQYSFKIRSYKAIGDDKYYSAYSPVLTVKTLNLPKSNEEAVESFVNAFNSTKAYTDECTAFVNTQVKNQTLTPQDGNFDGILNSIAKDEMKVYRFIGGEDEKNSVLLSNILSEDSGECQLSYEDILEDSVSYKENGSGFEVTFTLKQEDAQAAVNSQLTEVIDFDKVKSENEGFALTECTYSGTKINAKIQDGVISYISVEMPVEITFTIGGAEGGASQSISRFFALTYGD